MRHLSKRHFLSIAVLGFGCVFPRSAPPVSQSHDLTSVIDDLLTFHFSVLHDTVRLDACSIQRATDDSAILGRLSRRALDALTSKCEPPGTSFGRSRRSLVSIQSFPDSIIADVEAVEGDYFHVASYKALPVAEFPWFRFQSVTISHFGTTARPPPPPPPPKKK
jgi:hypothetical protein